jgi:hypothetical protein
LLKFSGEDKDEKGKSNVANLWFNHQKNALKLIVFLTKIVQIRVGMALVGLVARSAK